MAQFQSFSNTHNAVAQDRILLEMGMKFAIGRDCEIDVVEAHKWLNIAAIRGSEKGCPHAQSGGCHDEQGRTGSSAARREGVDDRSLTGKIVAYEKAAFKAASDC